LIQSQQDIRAELALQRQRVIRRLEDFERSPDRVNAQVAAISELDHALDALYLALEDQFRGGRAEIKKRLRVYLPWIESAGVARDNMPLLDVGCGRGEWLELLHEQGLTGTGVDSNRVLAEQCRELKLQVVEDDLMSYLRSLPDASLGAVTGFHIIEHLPIETLVSFFDETVRVLKSGGLIICETPNPENVLVGTCNFYFDPTHRNPLPSPITRFLIESRGFTNVEVLNLNPSDETPVAGDSDGARAVDGVGRRQHARRALLEHDHAALAALHVGVDVVVVRRRAVVARVDASASEVVAGLRADQRIGRAHRARRQAGEAAHGDGAARAGPATCA